MGRGKRYKSEEIIIKLREAEVLQIKDLEKENQQLKKLVADLSLDNSINCEPAKGLVYQ